MKTSVLLPFLMALFMASLCSAQNLSQFEGRLKKRSHNHSLQEKQLQPPATTGYYTPIVRQRTCGTMEADAALRARFPELGTLDNFERQMQQALQNQDIRGPQEIITIPVIVHVVHNGQAPGSGPNISQAQVQSQIDALNEDYRRSGAGFNNHPAGADVEIQFALALVDPEGNPLPEPGIDRINGGRNAWEDNAIEATLKPSTFWDPNRYCNIWTVQFGGSTADLLGYAQFPSLSSLPGLDQNMGPAQTDGVVIRWQSFGRVGNLAPPYDRGRTATHEIGHWLGLRHIWGDGGCAVDDFCADTPPAGQPNYSCIEVNSCAGGDRDMIENYMDYTEDACMSIFTNNQKARIRTVMDVSPRRKELKTSTVHLGGAPSGAPVASFTVSRRGACTGESITFNGQASNNPTSWQWAFYNEQGDLLATFSGQQQTINFNAPGLYSATLTVSNASGSDEVVENNLITIVSSTLTGPFTEDLEDLGIALEDWVLYNPDADRGFQIANVSSYGIGSHSLVFDNYSTQDDPSGTVDALISPALDFSGLSNPYLYFEHAYAAYGGQYSDTLVLFYSVDCGATFTPLWYKGGTELATAPTTQSPFQPNTNQWDWNQVSLGFLAGQPSVHLVLANLSGWGNYLYLDAISFIDGLDYTNSAPEVDFGVARTQVCAGELVQFQDYSSDFPNGWFWQFEGGAPSSSNAQHPFVQYNNPGFYDVSLTSANAFGSDGITAPNYIEVVPLPNLNVAITQGSPCGGQPFTLTASGANAYEWYDQRSGTLVFEGPSLTVTLYEDWEFTVLGRNNLGCESEEQFVVSISSPPTPTINFQGGQLVSSAANGYQWYLNGAPLSGATQQSIAPQGSGNYIVEVFGPDGCAALSQPFLLDLTGTSDPEDISASMKAFPNPTTGALQLEMDNLILGSLTIEVRNALGQAVLRQQVEKRAEHLSVPLDLAGLPNGLYAVTVEQEAYRGVKRIMKH
ncbi:MAG: PKD domain-containing protein [Lewinellaceae bacterium]|nr:PKD domain-containing protein [Phaeodactylibacter sp.]MCB9349153.1 PKD domain-containing protein [Lewinellaceae bacterium]